MGKTRDLSADEAQLLVDDWVLARAALKYAARRVDRRSKRRGPTAKRVNDRSQRITGTSITVDDGQSL